MGPEGSNTHVTTRVMGTSGYAAPEYVSTGHLTTKNFLGKCFIRVGNRKKMHAQNKTKKHGYFLWAMATPSPKWSKTGVYAPKGRTENNRKVYGRSAPVTTTRKT
ncbi:hypothetical protein ACFE04_015897 [Oxalis oulophora]